MIQDLLLRYKLVLTICIVFLITLIIKLQFRWFISGDMNMYLMPWCDFIATHEGLSAYKYAFSNYPPLYTYVLGFWVKFTSIHWVTGIKLTSVVFDYILAFYTYKIISLKHGKTWSVAAACLVSLLPTVITNSAMWGQCDVIYTAFVVMSIYYILTKKITFACILYGIAFSLKIQCVFAAPIFIILLFNNEHVKLAHFSLIPLVYIVTIIPCLIVGRPFFELLSIYALQVQEPEQQLVSGATNIYQLLPRLSTSFGQIAVLFTGICTIAISILYIKKKVADRDYIIELAFFCTLIIPFFLPYMHERYFYLADILAVIYVFYFKRNFYFLIIPIISMFSYLPYLYKTHFIDMRVLALAMLALIFMAGKDMIKMTTFK